MQLNAPLPSADCISILSSVWSVSAGWSRNFCTSYYSDHSRPIEPVRQLMTAHYSTQNNRHRQLSGTWIKIRRTKAAYIYDCDLNTFLLREYGLQVLSNFSQMANVCQIEVMHRYEGGERNTKIWIFYPTNLFPPFCPLAARLHKSKAKPHHSIESDYKKHKLTDTTKENRKQWRSMTSLRAFRNHEAQNENANGQSSTTDTPRS